MIYKNKNITVECVDKLVTIKKNNELLKAETYSNYNEAEEEYKLVDTEITKEGDTPTEGVKKWREQNEKV